MVFALALSNSQIRMYALGNPGSPPFLIQSLQDPVLNSPPEWTKLSFSNDGKFLLISTKANVLYIVDAFNAQLIYRLTGHINSGVCLEARFTPDAKYVICGIRGFSHLRVSRWQNMCMGCSFWSFTEPVCFSS
jgi:COMPASS component SWD2